MMDLFANLVANATAIAEKSGLSANQIACISASLQGASGEGCKYDEAVKATAEQNRVPVGKIEEVLGHVGLTGDLSIAAEGLFGGLISRPPRN